ncbi:uncharacterized protein FTOL_11367 [Fusarium torulosum]|uniref:Zn(2)-C6 fungal-type domain-containing protein n=1 Tax=Fusarium torulosum TaxID=33205 RepID=A0AAE8SNE2_9HYPO|nr:uncharacterized protein FTOL_11367 [Fusarium torulosum]
MAQPPAPIARARKRQRVESVYPWRRRSVIACNVCRGRQSKCDSGRPSCSFCLQAGITCVYEDQRFSYSKFVLDPMLALDRLDSLKQYMEERLGSWNLPRFVIFHHFPAGICPFCTQEAMINSVSQCNRTQTPPSLANTETAYYPVVESMLEWPVFEGLTSLRKGQSLAIADPDEDNYKESPDDPTNHRPETGSFGLDIDIDELSNELRTTTVGLEHLAFPYAFPQPPAQNGPSSSLASGGSARKLESWMYYLSETSQRRVGNEIIWTLYNQEPMAWTKDIPGLCARAQQLLDKLDAW